MSDPPDPHEPHFNGPEYRGPLDFSRLKNQHDRIRAFMLDGRWRTVAEIAAATKDPENSIQAQLRHLRKRRFGAFIVSRRRRGGEESPLWEYGVRPRTVLDPPARKDGDLKSVQLREATYEKLLLEIAAYVACRTTVDGSLLAMRIRNRVAEAQRAGARVFKG